MANTKQATKRARQSKKHAAHNMSLRSAMRTVIKSTLKVIKTEGKEKANLALRAMSSTVDKMASKGLIHKNKAARLKSRMNQKVKAL